MKALFMTCIICIAMSLVAQGRSSTDRDILRSNHNVEYKKADTAEFHHGMVTIKVKEIVGELDAQSGYVSFGINSLDNLVSTFEINSLKKRFKYNPEKLRDDLPDLSRIYQINFPVNYDVRTVAEEFSNNSNIEYAEPDPILRAIEVPDDELYSQLQHLPQIMAEEAWDIHQCANGTEEVIIGVVDTALEWYHPDILDNLWQNLGEDFDGDGHTIEFNGSEWIFDPGDENGLDDDNNGFNDDFIGWDFYNTSGSTDNDPQPEYASNEHGTHCSGIAAGVTNNGIGISSISWNAKVMPTKHSLDGSIVLDCYDGIIYCAENGADIISNSWGGGPYNAAYEDIIEYAIGLGSIIIAGAMNDANDQIKYPSSFPGVISVASVASSDVKSGYSCYGAGVDISAPGGDYVVDEGILSTILQGNYGTLVGTSMATPMVAGLLALIKSYNPTWDNEQIMIQLFGTADDINALNPGYENKLGYGRINALNALDLTNVTVSECLRLAIYDIELNDSNMNGILEQGEDVSVNLKLRNFDNFTGSNDVTVSLVSNDPEITITSISWNGAIGIDEGIEITDHFQFTIDESATTQITEISFQITAEVDILVGEEYIQSISIEPSGILVWEGVPDGDAYSGTYIKDYLIDQNYNVFYTNYFPGSLQSFDAAFLSFGNYGDGAGNYTYLDDDMTDSIISYLMNGGNVYLESSDAFGYDQSTSSAIRILFGIASAYDGDLNIIEHLEGCDGTITEGMLFSESNQVYNTYIDHFTPNNYGSEAFIESDYGCVAIQNEGAFDQRTFCLSYALADLVDEEFPSTRENLLAEITSFFEIDPTLLPPVDLIIDSVTGIMIWEAPTTTYPIGYDIYLDNVFQGNTTELQWQFTELANGISYVAGVAAVYDEGTSTIETIEFTYEGTNAGNDLITRIELKGNYPNPFNPSTTIEFSIDHNEHVDLMIYNLKGQKVKTFAITPRPSTKLRTVSGDQRMTQAGSNQYSVIWNGRDDNDKPVSSGIYFYKLKTDSYEETKKMILMK